MWSDRMDPAEYDSDMPAEAAPILVVDDDAKIVRLIRTYLEREGYRVVEASDGRSALAAVALEEPMLVVLDVMLPEVDGLAITRAVRRNQRTPVVLVSARGTVADRIAGLTEGADDYLPKPFSPAELVVRIKRVLERTAGDRSTGRQAADGRAGATRLPVIRRADLVVDRERHETTVGGRLVELTALEFRLLDSLIEADGRVLTRDQLMDAIYGEADGDVLDRSVDALVKRLRDKLGDDAEKPRYVATVRGVGYRAARVDDGDAPGEAGGPQAASAGSS
jgi:DNA-binding response OmpR family regulator